MNYTLYAIIDVITLVSPGMKDEERKRENDKLIRVNEREREREAGEKG